MLLLFSDVAKTEDNLIWCKYVRMLCKADRAWIHSSLLNGSGDEGVILVVRKEDSVYPSCKICISIASIVFIFLAV